MFEIDVDQATIIPGPDGNVRIRFHNISGEDALNVIDSLMLEGVILFNDIINHVISVQEEPDVNCYIKEILMPLIDINDLLECSLKDLANGANLTRILRAMLDRVDADIIQQQLNILKNKKK